MKHIFFLVCLTLLSINILIPIHAEQEPNSSSVFGDKQVIIYKFDIKKEITPGLWRQMKHAFVEANEISADIILLHMNTYGGMLDAADSMRTKILSSKIPVYVFIDNNAASAGALISIACDSIYMRSGANIGAATVVTQTGEAAPDKYQSYMRAMMRSTAETSGRDPDIAQAMVDPNVYVKGVNDSGQVITFTTSEAIKYGFCEAQAETIDEIMKINRVENYKIVSYKTTVLDVIIGFLVNPIVSGILILLMIAGIYYEMQSPGIGFPLFVSITAAILYFAPLYLEGLVEHWEILVCIIGVVLIVIEIFVTPGFGVLGILGVIFVLFGLTVALVPNKGFDFTFVPPRKLMISSVVTLISLPFGLIVSFILGEKMLTSKRFSLFVLDSTQKKENGFTSARKHEETLVGKTGIAYTVLRPAGKVMIDDDIYDARADIGFIEKGEKIKVIRYEAMQLHVIKL